MFYGGILLNSFSFKLLIILIQILLLNKLENKFLRLLSINGKKMKKLHRKIDIQIFRCEFIQIS